MVGRDTLADIKCYTKYITCASLKTMTYQSLTRYAIKLIVSK